MQGCTSAYGRLQHDPLVTDMFRTGAVPETYRYFFDGRGAMPYAFIGIDPRYTPVLRFWEPVAPGSERFAQMIPFIWMPEDWGTYSTGQGAWILDAEGNRLGIWYSMYPHATIRLDASDRVTVYSPAFGEGERMLGQ
ncbi:hypothetical protein [Desulfatitalea alkaliphila]|uniref:Uncharacterized protein n=1 Tax=Desulfatitalea alkaliphila TaxID=2929485 RepID=A0AA41R1A3_9BACT|nr:hypothetical protein [Desulfatitalea alkaliphila]MCJ8499791.1 hypothetical protein [Desulfatitalea alkaliphila]